MRTKLCMAVLVTCLAATGEAAAQNYCELEKLHINAEGDGVSADFSSVDTSACELGIETTVHVDGSQGVIHTSDDCGQGGSHTSTVTTSESNAVAVVISERTSDHINSNQGILRVIFNSSETIRDAVAVGSVAIDGTDETPLPSTRGTIEKNALRDLVVYR